MDFLKKIRKRYILQQGVFVQYYGRRGKFLLLVQVQVTGFWNCCIRFA